MADGVAVNKLGILPSSLLWRLTLRTLFVVLIAVIACAVPFFGGEGEGREGKRAGRPILCFKTMS